MSCDDSFRKTKAVPPAAPPPDAPPSSLSRPALSGWAPADEANEFARRGAGTYAQGGALSLRSAESLVCVESWCCSGALARLRAEPLLSLSLSVCVCVCVCVQAGSDGVWCR